MKDALKNTLVVIIAIGILKILFFTLKLNGADSIKGALISTNALENTYYISQIMTSIFVILGTVIAVWQYILSSKEARKLQDKERVQKAIDLAGYYKDNILSKTLLIIHIYKAAGITDILNKIDFQKIEYFDMHELEENISTSDQDFLKNAIKSKKMIDALVEESEMTKIWEDCKEIEFTEKDGKKIKTLKVAPIAILHRFQKELNEILNNLEFFAMHFTHEAADDSVIYQSLHQSYLSTVKLLYYDIAVNNKPGDTKLYTNVIELYNKWSEKAREQKAIETRAVRGNIIKGKILNKS